MADIDLRGGHSELARELAEMRPSVRERLRVPAAAIVFVDMVVTVCVVMSDDSDERPLLQRFDDLVKALTREVDAEELNKVTAYIEQFTEEDLPGWTRRMNQQLFRRFLRQAVGAAQYDRLARGLLNDAAAVALAVRRGLRATLPIATALDDAAAALSPEQLRDLPDLPTLEGSMLAAVLGFDSQLDGIVGHLQLPLDLMATRDGERTALAVEDLGAFVAQLRDVISGRTREQLLGLSDALARKLQGARDALDHSADGVSQAANSTIETIDRLLRGAFDDDTVLEWVAAHPDMDGMSYIAAEGKVRPTKRAQALCFAYAGRMVAQRSPMHEIAAAGLVAARARLQRLKHADEGTPEERADVVRHLATVEGAFMFVLSVAWSSVGDDDLTALRARFAGADGPHTSGRHAVS